MCGIVGLLQPASGDAARRQAAHVQQIVRRMLDQVQHRGPDACGLEVIGDDSIRGPIAALGHTRLAILDLSPAGRQPMVTPDRAHWITFNGEIYNFRALRDELADSGAWRSRSDTEVLLRAYARWGRACLDRLRGMFAFAIWDAQRRELFLARDRLGIKPLYYAQTSGGGFVFGSEVRALLASGLVERQLDPIGISEYLTYQAVPAPRTLIAGVRSLPPAGWLTVDANGDLHQGSYWDLLGQPTPGESAPSPAESRRRVAELLREAVALHLVSDVPVGAFLSGGIDSTAIVALMREAGSAPRTFTVALPQAAFDESAHARQVATHFGTEHTELLLHEPNVLRQLPDALAAMDQPTGDGVNTYIVARAVRATGIKVALSGLGGDELFAGYPSFARLERSAGLFRAWGKAPTAVRTLTAHGLRTFGHSSVAATKTAAMLASNGDLASLYPLTRQVLSDSQRRALLADAWAEPARGRVDPYAPLLRAAFGRSPRPGVLTAISFAEARTYMHDVLLRDTDQMSMAHALEVRVPLLDHRLVEYVMSLPDSHKRPAGTPKRLLVEALDGLLPENIVHRPKQGFALPFDVWMRGPLRGFCEQRLGPRGLGCRGIFAPDAAHALWRAFLVGQPAVTWSRVWLLVVLEEWLANNGF